MSCDDLVVGDDCQLVSTTVLRGYGGGQVGLPTGGGTMDNRQGNQTQLVNFSWLIDECLAGCAYPQSDEALAELAGRGVRLVVNLHERPLDSTRLAEHGMVELHLPVRDFTAPSVEQLARGVTAIEEAIAQGKRVAVHCGVPDTLIGTRLGRLRSPKRDTPQHGRAGIFAVERDDREAGGEDCKLRGRSRPGAGIKVGQPTDAVS